LFIRGPIPFFGHILVGKIWLVPAPFSDHLNYIYIYIYIYWIDSLGSMEDESGRKGED